MEILGFIVEGMARQRKTQPESEGTGLHRTQIPEFASALWIGSGKVPDHDAYADQDDRESEQLVWSIHA
jgi:hypothetical protein